MEQLEFFDIPSPCVGVCEANNRGYCKGCLRSRDERLHWLSFDAEKKRHVIRLCQQRKARVLEARLSRETQQEFFFDEEPDQQSMFNTPP